MPLYGGEPSFAKHRKEETKHDKQWSGSWTQKKNRQLDEALRSNKKASFRTIKFVPAKKKENGSIDASNTDPDFSSSMIEPKKSSGDPKSDQDDDAFPVVDHPLYPITRIKRLMAWSLVRKIGPGLINSGNTCFCNSVLQCLTYTPPLANFCLNREHAKRCTKSNVATNGVFDAFAALEQHIQHVFSSGKSAIRPSGLYRNETRDLSYQCERASLRIAFTGSASLPDIASDSLHCRRNYLLPQKNRIALQTRASRGCTRIRAALDGEHARRRPARGPCLRVAIQPYCSNWSRPWHVWRTSAIAGKAGGFLKQTKIRLRN